MRVKTSARYQRNDVTNHLLPVTAVLSENFLNRTCNIWQYRQSNSLISCNKAAVSNSLRLIRDWFAKLIFFIYSHKAETVVNAAVQNHHNQSFSCIWIGPFSSELSHLHRQLKILSGWTSGWTQLCDTGDMGPRSNYQSMSKISYYHFVPKKLDKGYFVNSDPCYFGSCWPVSIPGIFAIENEGATSY